MTMPTSAGFLTPWEPLVFQPHRVSSTGVSGLREVGLLESPWDGLSPQELAAIEGRWVEVVLERVRESALAALYRAGEAEDLALAEADLGDYNRLLDDADRA